MRLSMLAILLPALACVVPAAAQEMSYTPLAPCRVLDTRLATGGAKIAGGATRVVKLRGVATNFSTQGGASTGCGVPDPVSSANIAQAVAVNIVAVSPDGPGFLVAFATGTAAPAASTLNYSTGGTIANGVIVPICTGSTATGGPCQNGDLNILAGVSASHVIVDVVGYFHRDVLRVGTVTNVNCDGSPGSGDVCAGTDLVADGSVFATTMKTGAPSNANCNNSGDICATTDVVADGDVHANGSIRTGTPSNAFCDGTGDICATTDVVADINVRAGTFVSAGSDVTAGRNVVSANYGALKAAAYLRCRDSGGLLYSYNAEPGASTTYSESTEAGHCIVTFGFPIDPNAGARRFVNATCVSASARDCTVVLGFAGTSVHLRVFVGGAADDGQEVMLTVF